MAGLLRVIVLLCAALLEGGGASAATTKNIGIVVTHDGGGIVTTHTWVNNSAVTVPPGHAVIFGQAFRRGDFPAGSHPLFRDAQTHVPLVQQLDEIATRRENGDDGSIRHVVFSYQLPIAVPPGGTYTAEIVKQTGTYSATGKQGLAGLAAAHDLKLRLTDVRNQDDTVRGSGSLTFRINTAAANTGRDMPRRCGGSGDKGGPVRDCWIVSGPPIDDVTHQPDPLLYFTCFLDLTTSAADQASLGDVRWVCAAHNSWMNVKAGSAGNPGAPGPPGYPRDPQAVSYRPEMLDGAASVLDWNGLDATVASSNSPVRTTGCGSDYQAPVPACLDVPSSNGRNSWYYGQAVRVSSTGTPVGGLVAGRLYFVYNTGSANSNGARPNLVSLMPQPVLTAGPEVLTTAQGSGTTSFSYRLLHAKFLTWLTLGPTGDENWTSGRKRVTWQLLPALTSAEKRYWEATGTVIPMDLAQSSSLGVPWSDGCDLSYHPLGRLMTIGGTGPGPRPDIGIINEYAAQAFIRGNPDDWTKARLFTLGTTHYQYGSVLNEATGRIPAINNGPPTGPGGNGIGGSYPELGAPHNNLQFSGSFPLSSGLAFPLENVPHNGAGYAGGMWGEGGGFYISHEPSFTSLTYLVFGSRHLLELMWFHGNRTYYMQGLGPGDGGRDNILDGNHYWGLSVNCCQNRGAYWALRDRLLPAALGGDGNIERTYFNHFLVETNNYYPYWLAWKDGSVPNFSHALMSPNVDGRGSDTFIDAYGVTTCYLGKAMLHDPLCTGWLAQWARFIEGVCGETAPGHISAFYCVEYTYTASIHDGSHPVNTGNVGQYFNGTDASDYGAFAPYYAISPGSGQVKQIGPTYQFQPGDTVKLIGNAFSNSNNAGIDQLSDATRWYRVLGPIDNKLGTFWIENPATPGVPFNSYTRGGSPLNDSAIALIARPQYAPATGYREHNYTGYMGEIISALKISGYSVNRAYAIGVARGIPSSYDSATKPSQKWDATIVVP